MLGAGARLVDQGQSICAAAKVARVSERAPRRFVAGLDTPRNDEGGEEASRPPPPEVAS